jgi:aminoglycoside phosphotransferase (APT) family kinase protein
MAQAPANEDALLAFLRSAGLCGRDGEPVIEPLTGGVASDIVKVECGGRHFVVKRALARLKVAREWLAPISRNASEVAYMQVAGAIVPGHVPRVIAHDPAFGGYAMDYLPPDTYALWKTQLRDGHVDPDFAASLGAIMAAIHARTAGSQEIARRFANDSEFHALRLEPYLEATAELHPALHERLHALSRETLGTQLALVHGDISPKNILCGPHGPVLLDAECAWYGDPAFDLAFCLNHLLLKCLWTPSAAKGFLACFDALSKAYLSAVTWEEPVATQARAASLLPALLLARVDGKSPVEYLTDGGKTLIRRFAPPLILDPPSHLSAISGAWAKETLHD